MTLVNSYLLLLAFLVVFLARPERRGPFISSSPRSALSLLPRSASSTCSLSVARSVAGIASEIVRLCVVVVLSTLDAAPVAVAALLTLFASSVGSIMADSASRL